jgi:hypothetical protein
LKSGRSSRRTSEEEGTTQGSIESVMPAWLDHDKTIATLSKRPAKPVPYFEVDE